MSNPRPVEKTPIELEIKKRLNEMLDYSIVFVANTVTGNAIIATSPSIIVRSLTETKYTMGASWGASIRERRSP